MCSLRAAEPPLDPVPMVTTTRTVSFRFQLASPERGSFKPTPPLALSNPLRLRGSDIRTKLAVVRLRQRNSAERDENGPKWA